MEIALLNVAGEGRPRPRSVPGIFRRPDGADLRRASASRTTSSGARGEARSRPETLADALAGEAYDVVVVTHVDTGTGACAPVEAYAEVLQGRGILYIVDGVCATGGIEERMDDWGIDVILTAAQKCFGAPPGLAIDVFSQRAMAKRRGLPSVPAYYSDILRWLPIMKDPSKYFSTPCVNEIRAFAEATRMMLEEGMPAPVRAPAKNGPGVPGGASAALGFRIVHRSGVSGRHAFGRRLSGRRGRQGVPDRRSAGTASWSRADWPRRRARFSALGPHGQPELRPGPVRRRSDGKDAAELARISVRRRRRAESLAARAETVSGLTASTE